MVKLTKIYTRSGDKGTTGLGNGKRVLKHDPRVDAYGGVDELNAFLGLAVCTAKSEAPALKSLLESFQHDLFDLGADLCTPIDPDAENETALRILPERIDDLESTIDLYNAKLESLKSFVLPGGTKLAAELHVVRTVCRRAERTVTALIELEPDTTSDVTLQYLNRLSDVLFVLARCANLPAGGDVLWVPGKNRKPDS